MPRHLCLRASKLLVTKLHGKKSDLSFKLALGLNIKFWIGKIWLARSGSEQHNSSFHTIAVQTKN